MFRSKRLRQMSVAIIFSLFINLLFINITNADPLVTNGSNQMSTGGSQTLTVSGGCGGPYNWSLSGGGNISSSIGDSITYTAPSTNPNCTNNPTICVTDSSGQQTCMQIAVNTSNDSAPVLTTLAFANCECTRFHYCPGDIECSLIQLNRIWTQYRCDGSIYHVITETHWQNCGWTNCGDYINFWTPPGYPSDDRTAQQKSEGCCPPQLLPPPPPPPPPPTTCCNLKITDFTGAPATIKPQCGGLITFSGSISSSNPVTWTLTVSGRTFNGTGNSVSVSWDGKDSAGNAVEPGFYAATLSASETNNPTCSKSQSTSFTVEAGCNSCRSNLSVNFDSTLNVASGNLLHTQTLFTMPNSRLMSDFTLSYNSADGYNGVLGAKWTHTYNINLKADTANDIYTLMDESGGRTVLYKNGSYYTPNESVYPTLTKNADNTLTLAYKNGTIYIFNAQGKLTGIADKNGNAVSLAYDGVNNLVTISYPSGTINLNYDANNRISSITDLNNNSYNFTYSSNTLTSVSSNNSLGTQTWIYTYDSNAFMLTKTDPQGNLIQYTYDANHRIIQSSDPQGKTRNVQYDMAGKTATVTEKDGGIWVYNYDPVLGALGSKTVPAGGAINYKYDTNGNVISKIEADGSTTSYTYDANGNTTSVTDPLGKITTYTYNSLNLVASMTDPNGHITQYSYDAQGNLTSVTDATNAATRYQYDAKGNNTAITNPLSKTTSMAYDQYNNLITVIDPRGGTVTMAYDNLGNMIRQTDALGNVTNFQYNSLNQMTQITDPLGKITRYTYDYKGNRLSATDANNNTTQYAYDYKSQLTKITDALNNITNMAYSGTGCASCGTGVDKLTALTDAKNQTTTYQYDQTGRLLQETDPLGKITTYTYDSKGNLITRTSPDNKTITYSYDQNNRLTQKTYSDNTITSFQYDNAGNVTYAGNQNITYSFTYDAANRITQIADSSGRIIQYQYDAAGNRSVMITPDNRTINYAYDFNNLLTQMTTDLGNFTFTYDSVNRRTTRTLPNGTTATYSYDQGSRLTGIQTTKGATTIDSVGYTYDNAGNRITKTQPPVSYNYSYDAIYRLTQTTPAGGTQQPETYTYDQVGNRLTKVPDTPPSANETTIYSYDDENRLTGVQITANNKIKQLSFAYDPFGRRISKTLIKDEIGTDCQSPNICPRTTNYVYDNQSIILEYDQTGSITAKYTHGPGIDEPLAVTQNTNTYFYHADGLGSITALTNTSGTVVQTYSYDSFGNVITTGNISQPFTYTGREYDSETGMYFYRARYYDSKVGRFVTKDPIGFKGGINQYAYVANNPVNLTDPSGLKSIKEYYDDLKKVKNVYDNCKDLFPNGVFKCNCDGLDKCLKCTQAICEAYGPVGSTQFGACIYPLQKTCNACLEKER